MWIRLQPNPGGLHVVNEAGAVPEDPEVRRDFVLWVYVFVALQLSCTGLLIVTPMQVLEEIDSIELIGTFIFLIAFIVIFASRRVRRGICGGFWLSLVTLFLATVISKYSARPSENTVLMAACVTAGVTLTMTYFSACIKAFDVTKYYAVMIVFTFFVMGCYLLLALVVYLSPDGNLAQVIIASIGILPSIVLLLYGIHTIQGGRKIVIRPDEMIFGSMSLYVNIVFIYGFLLFFEFS